MAENRDLYKLGQSQEGSIVDKGQEIRIDLQLEENIISEVGTVFGRVMDVDSNPMEGVTIKITDTEYNPKYHAVTDAQGQYTIDNVEANEQYLILAVKEEYELKTGVPFVMRKGQQVERNFVMTVDPNAGNSLIAGEIFDKNQNKLVGITVSLYDNSGTNPVLIKTTHSNQFGQYAFFDVSQGVYLVTSSMIGYKTAQTTFVISASGQVVNINLTMLDDPIGRMGTINGVIKDKNGIPIEGAFVVLFEVTTDKHDKEVLTPIRKTVTNSEGVYLFEQVPQGNYKIKANKLAPQ